MVLFKKIGNARLQEITKGRRVNLEETKKSKQSDVLYREEWVTGVRLTTITVTHDIHWEFFLVLIFVQKKKSFAFGTVYYLNYRTTQREPGTTRPWHHISYISRYISSICSYVALNTLLHFLQINSTRSSSQNLMFTRLFTAITCITINYLHTSPALRILPRVLTLAPTQNHYRE